MVVKTNSAEVSNTYVFNRKAGRSIIERRPVFSPDGESVAIIVENLVRVYSIQTGDCVRTLETEVSINELVSVQFPEDEDYNLYGCSDDGYVTTWSWEQGAVLRKTKLQIPENTKIITFNLADSNECFIIAIDEKRKLHLGTYSVKDGGLLHEYKDLKIKYHDIICVSLGWCYNDRFAAIANGTMMLFIQNLNQPHLKLELVNYNKFRILSVAAHHKESTVAITDTIGRVTIIRGNLYSYKSIAREVLHWHFLPPLAVCFSVQGNYLISGGMENVLVKWTLGNLQNKTNEKAFIPRLPGMIRYVTTNNTHIAITLSNNSVVIANAQMRVVSTILECGGLSPVCKALGAAFVYHRPLSALLMPGRTGHLQLYSTTTDKVLYNIDITAMNNIPPERQNLLPLETEVTCAAISADGSWLVTSEYRNDGINYPEEKLKFWAAQANNTSPFKLNTCVSLSHGGCNVVSLALNNKGEFCVSSGTDQKFRIWKRDSTSQQHRKKVIWGCLTACYYSSGITHFLSNPVLNNFKSGEILTPGKVEILPYMKEINRKTDVLRRIINIHKEHNFVDASVVDRYVVKDDEFAMGGVAISQDGSLIAAWFGCKLTLWDSHLCNLRTTLSHPALRPKGIHVQFGNNDAAHYLVCTTENCVAVWSLLSLTIKWMVQIKSTCLVSDPFSNKMAMVTTNNDVYVFSPHSSTPFLIQKRLLNPETGVFKQCVFGTSVGEDIRLYVMRNDSEIYCLEPEKSEEGQLEAISQRRLPPSAFHALLAHRNEDVAQNTHTHLAHTQHDALGNNAISQFLSAAPHMIPPVSLLCPLFLQHISGYKEVEEGEEDDTNMEIDPQSSDEEDTEVKSSHTPKAVQLWVPNYEEIKEKRLKKILKEPLLDLHSTSSLFVNILSWSIEEYSDQLVGYLGEHLSLTVRIEDKGDIREMIFFIKCIPRHDEWMANYLRETNFFNKEYVMLSSLFQMFRDDGLKKWRPKLLHIKEELFVFEDVTQTGYTMPNNLNTLNYEELKATVTALAKFHAQSYVFEQRKSQVLKRPYRIWEDYSEYLCEPSKGQSWRDTGMRAAIDFLKVFSEYKSKPNFTELIEQILPKLFSSAEELMKPSMKIRNVVIHRDLWSNNIFLKKLENSKMHALLIDFQTVLYSLPMLDLSSLIYFNTTKLFRNNYTKRIIDHYYHELNEELKSEDIDVQSIVDNKNKVELYEESLVFGMTQAALIVPIIAMTNERRKQYFTNPESCYKINCISRSQEFIELAKENMKYQRRVIELLDEIVERFVYPSTTANVFK
ncbi:WD repeat-containing protein 75-like [Nymphalis io]|uniref:WD repeat-containing protein 75-like n=1 Tax=Inachis io TaxID=171585 RepID=UPI00216A551D|nr:WD repeat-containing protein 75-like [Nymphalis io]